MGASHTVISVFVAILVLALAGTQTGCSKKQTGEPCDYYGGFQRGASWSGATTCTCQGKKKVLHDEAPVDGITETLCIGTITKKTCSKKVGGVVTSEDCLGKK